MLTWRSGPDVDLVSSVPSLPPTDEKDKRIYKNIIVCTLPLVSSIQVHPVVVLRWLGILPAAYVLFIALVAKSQRRPCEKFVDLSCP